MALQSLHCTCILLAMALLPLPTLCAASEAADTLQGCFEADGSDLTRLAEGSGAANTLQDQVATVRAGLTHIIDESDISDTLQGCAAAAQADSLLLNPTKRFSIQVDAAEFFTSLTKDILQADSSIYIETLSFEADTAGDALAALLRKARAPDIRLLIDAYTQFVISDRFIHRLRNRRDEALRREVEQTRALIASLRSGGIAVQFTNPLGPLLRNFISRNHKKLIVIDGRIAYIGGINFSEHNFRWHDLMLRVEDPAIAAFLMTDFASTWQGRNLNTMEDFGDVELLLFDGGDNRPPIQRVLDLIDSSRHPIQVESPYLSQPFLSRVRAARARGVAVTLIAPEKNNRGFMNSYIRFVSQQSGFTLYLYKKEMTHLKAMLIDDEYLLLGSVNFEFMGQYQQEILAVIRNQELIEEFKEKVFEEDIRNSALYQGRISFVRGNAAVLRMHLLGAMALILRWIR